MTYVQNNPKVSVAGFSESNPPWNTSPVAKKYPTYDDLLKAMQDDNNATIYVAPFNLLRSFHPKGTAHGYHKDLFMVAIADNRDSVTA